MNETELTDVFEPATIPGLTKRLYELRRQLSAMKSEEENLTAIIKEHCRKTGEVIEVEGLPALRLLSGRGTTVWDSHAIQKLIDEWPQEFRKLVELGAVTLSASVIRDNIKRGQLVRLPTGGYEKPRESLTFDRKE